MLKNIISIIYLHYKKFLFLAMLVLVVFLMVPLKVYYTSASHIYESIDAVPQKYTAVLMGAMVMPSGRLSHVMYDRAMAASKLYKAGKVKRILMTGDHGRKNYDEVNTVRKFLIQQGVPDKHIFMDHAGFNTYSSMVRAEKIFKVRDAVIVTQKYHLYRSVYTARQRRITAVGYVADARKYPYMRNYIIREFAAIYKTYFENLLNIRPKYLGEEIPITGNAFRTRD